MRFTAVGASLSYIGSDILIYIDTLAPANGFTPSQLQSFGQLFDQILYPLDTNTFGPPTDIDQNGHLIVLLSPIVNALTPASSCNTEGFIGGFFDGIDLASTDTSSNRGEIFYSLVPDPNATDPNNADSDGDHIPDGAEDSNQNGRVDPGELDPNNSADGGDPTVQAACALNNLVPLLPRIVPQAVAGRIRRSSSRTRRRDSSTGCCSRLMSIY